MFFSFNIKLLVRICFYVILSAVCVTSWIKVLKEPTTFEEKIVKNQARLPSFTLCPTQPIGDKSIESFEDIDKAIEHVRYKYTLKYCEYKAHEQDKCVENEYNDTSYGSWYFAPQISVSFPFETVICLIWTPSRKYIIKSDWMNILTTSIESLQSPEHILQFHEEANSPYLYEFAQDEWEWIENDTHLIMVLGKQTDTKNINKSNYTCYEENSNTFMDCMENYYSIKLGCLLPWSLNRKIENDSMNLCKGKEKFAEFKSIAMNILKSEAKKELTNKGCFIPNCLQRSWTNHLDIKSSETKNLMSGFDFEMPPHGKVLVREEVMLYTLMNFFAEVGGYLGLLLGESLLSYFITASTLFQTLRRKFKEHCRKADEQEPETILA